MSAPSSAVYVGRVVHKRLRPKPHAFAYKVFALALDLDEIAGDDVGSRLFRCNRPGLLSFHDADHGCGDGRPIAQHIRAILDDAGLAGAGRRIVLLCYPRLFGYVFNPLSVFFCYGAEQRLGAVVYEVSNTFRERTSYVIPVAPDERQRIVRQACAKRMYVSPFTAPVASYGFHVSPPADEVVVAVTLRDPDGPLLKTHFRGDRRPLTDRTLAAMLLGHPLMTIKVMGGIHYEAARLWLKGVPVVRRHASAKYSVAIVGADEQSHADEGKRS